jgi:hypothetical protein
MATTTTTPPLNAQTTQETNLSTWAGPYITTMLGQAEALGPAVYDASGALVSGTPFKGYTPSVAAEYKPMGQALTAGESQLQTKAFQGLGALTVPSALTTAGTQAIGTYDTSKQYMPTVGTVQSYMNPYLEAVLEPQRREATRQADIARNEMQSRMAKAGAYGGSRQAIMEAEAQRNLQTLLGDITGKGYSGAYEAAQRQRQADIDAGLRGLSAQTAATQALTQAGSQQGEYGLRNIQQQLAAGQTQRDIDQAGLTAAYNQFLREEQYPKEQLQFQRQMITGIPGIATSSFYTTPADPFGQATQGAQGLLALLSALKII